MPEIKLHTEIISHPSARIAEGLSITHARDLLDWLEAHGVHEAEIDIAEDERISVMVKA